MIMKYSILILALVFSGFAQAAPRKVNHKYSIGEGMRAQKSLTFDGRTIESLRGGKYDSYTHMVDGNGNGNNKKLYSLPRDFSNRVATDGTEMRYRK